MTGGFVVPGEDTENVSVRHCDLLDVSISVAIIDFFFVFPSARAFSCRAQDPVKNLGCNEIREISDGE